MSEHKAHHQVEIGSERNFGIVFAAVFTIIALIPLIGDGSIRYWALAFAAGFLACAFAAPKILRPLNQLWGKFGILLGKIIAPIVMGILYFGVITPIGLIMRACGKDFLHMRKDDKQTSYWMSRENHPMGSMKDQF